MESAMNSILAAADKGDPTAPEQARKLAFEKYPTELGCNAADRERFFHSVAVRLNAYRGP
jgi:hypothetical protein